MQTATSARVDTPARARASTVIAVRPLRDVSVGASSCTDCSLRTLCMPVEIDDPESEDLLRRLVAHRTRLRKGEVLFRPGDRFVALYAIRLGSLKTVALADDGSELVTGYHLTGEIVGLDGMGQDTYASQALALEDTEVCILPIDRIERLAHREQSFQQRLYRLLSGAISRERANALMLGTMRAEQRLASFLLDLSARYQTRGYSATEFVLRMTREEIGSHLGLKLETVSRLLSRFDEEGLIQVRGRVIKLLDRLILQRLIAAS